MARLIDAENAIKKLEDIGGHLIYEEDGKSFCITMDALIRFINNLPTIDPVKQEWISVRDRLPEERDSIFARFYGTEKWKAGMFRTASDDVIACVEYEDGSRLVKVLHTISGEWHMSGIPGGGIVTHWMPLPEPPEREGE